MCINVRIIIIIIIIHIKHTDERNCISYLYVNSLHVLAAYANAVYFYRYMR